MAAAAKTGPARPEGIADLHLPVNPSNVKVGGRFHVEGVTGDLYDIANRLKELHPGLFISLLEDRSPEALVPVTYVIMERTMTGEERVVFKCRELDARVIEYVRYLLRVPFERRFAEAEKMLDKYESEQKSDEMDELIENLGLPMLKELRETGFLGHYSKGIQVDAARVRGRRRR